MRKVVLFLTRLVVCLSICILVTSGLRSLSSLTVAKALQIKEGILESMPLGLAQAAPLQLAQVIEKASQAHGVSPIVLQVICDKESSGGSANSLYRFEPGLYTRLRSNKSYRQISDSELRMLSSSHGAFHILGLTAERECQLHFSKLYDLEVSANCAAKIVRRIEDGIKSNNTEYKLFEIFRQYNGQGAKAEQYATDAMGRLASLLYRKLNG
jgi:hypothetical protein